MMIIFHKELIDYLLYKMKHHIKCSSWFSHCSPTSKDMKRQREATTLRLGNLHLCHSTCSSPHTVVSLCLCSRPYLARQRALHWWREEPGSVRVQRLWSLRLQTFRGRRGGVQPEAHSWLQVHPEPGQ